MNSSIKKSTESIKRPSTPHLREMDNKAQNFCGLPEGVSPFEFVKLLRQVGKQLGFTNILINHLEYLISHTKQQDWEEGNKPIVFKSVQRMAIDLGISERQINERERKLHNLCCLTWNDLNNHKRTGYRNKNGILEFAFGVNLAPLAFLYDNLVELKQDQDKARQEWASLKKQIGFYRKKVVSIVGVLPKKKLDPSLDGHPAVYDRIHANTSLELLSRFLKKLKEFYNSLSNLIVDNSSCQQKTSDWSEENFRHNYFYFHSSSSKEEESNPDVPNDTDPKQVNFDELPNLQKLYCSSKGNVRKQKEVRQIGSLVASEGDKKDVGLQHINLQMLRFCVSDRIKPFFRNGLQNATWIDFLDVADWRSGELGIPGYLWRDACDALGRNGAAAAIVIIDSNLDHPTHAITSPKAVFYSFVKLAREGKLNLHKSIFGIYERSLGRN